MTLKFCSGILTDEKKDADKQLEKEVAPGDVSNEEEVSVTTENQGSGKKSQRKRKRKSYGKDFKENYDAEESDNSEENDSMFCLTSVNITNAKYQNQTNSFIVQNQLECLANLKT